MACADRILCGNPVGTLILPQALMVTIAVMTLAIAAV